MNIFFKLFCLAAEDSYNDGTIGGDGSVYRILCDLCIRLDGSPGCEDPPIAIMQKKKKIKAHSFVHNYVKKMK